MLFPGVEENPAGRPQKPVQTWVPILIVLVLLSGLVTWLECRPRERDRLTPQMAGARDTLIRVRLLSNVERFRIQITNELSLRDVGSGYTVSLKDLAHLHHIDIGLIQGRLTLAGHPIDVDHLEIHFGPPGIFSMEGERFRGQLEVIVDGAGTSFDVINHLPLEPYLAGVVGAEMPSYWEPEALKAQAIASRTYCLYIKERFGRHRPWDVSRSQAHQVYRGVAAESAAVWDAVRATQGQVLVTEGQDGAPIVLPAYYSSICGGHTEDSNQVFGEASVVLRGVDCWSCEDVAKATQFNWPVVTYSKQEVSQRLLARYPALCELGAVQEIVTTRQSEYDQFSRITQVRLVGQDGRSSVLRGEDMRLAIDPSGRRIKSTGCRLEDRGEHWAFVQGRGWGHAVGMCQCGAQGLARAGLSVQDILVHYYPGARIGRRP
ncbi:MAG: SpoIID/LytB domain-containing protein [Planctomycetes bacterium]|nr:SpoIID/LytB domain-containing protein [Planctomycetota bacterium]